MTPDQQAEMLELQRTVQSYLDTLVVSGFDERTVVAATLTALTERVVVASSPTQTAAWLRGHALMIERYGAAIKAERAAG